MLWLIAAAAVSALNLAPGSITASPPIQVMVVGTWHFANNNRDLHNVDSVDVRTSDRQRQLRVVAAAIEAYKPTKVMVKRVAPGPDLIDPDFVSFTPAMLRTGRSERFQIGYRVAHDLGLASVYAINEFEDFPYEKVQAYAVAHGRTGYLDKLNEAAQKSVEAFTAKQSHESISELLLEANAPDYVGGISAYYSMLSVGDATQQPGAELNAMWYLRNAKIFAKLITVAQPGDRVLVIYGAGHAYWLRHFAKETPGFANVNPLPYLRKARRY